MDYMRDGSLHTRHKFKFPDIYFSLCLGFHMTYEYDALLRKTLTPHCFFGVTVALRAVCAYPGKVGRIKRAGKARQGKARPRFRPLQDGKHHVRRPPYLVIQPDPFAAEKEKRAKFVFSFALLQ